MNSSRSRGFKSRTPVFALGFVMALTTLEAAFAGNGKVQLDEVCGGVNGNSTVQFIEMKSSSGHNLWGPQPGEAESRAMLVFYDSTGAETKTLKFGSDPPQIDGTQDPQTPDLYSALICTDEFQSIPTAPRCDFVINREIFPQAGKVCFRNNPDNPNADRVNICLSYGDNQNPDVELGRLPFAGDTEGAGPPADALPMTDVSSLRRFQSFDCNSDSCHLNADFAVLSIDPRNSDGQIGTVSLADIRAQGETIFKQELFEGNSRVCFSCHKTGTVAEPIFNSDKSGGLSSAFIQLLHAQNPDDPLFIAENDPVLAQLENPCLMVLGDGGNAGMNRGLILENINGFGAAPFFRESTHLVNVKFTAPYGHNDQVPNLRLFCRGATKQHLPRFIGPRNFDPTLGPISARIPNEAESVAMEAFMFSVRLPSDLPEDYGAGGNAERDAEIDRMITSSVECRDMNPSLIATGRSIFFSPISGKCAVCHNSSTLSGLPFDTGVSNLDVNDDDGCQGGPGDPGLGLPFDPGPHATPPLFGVSITDQRFFHGHEVASLREAVEFYNSNEFLNSPGGQQVNGIFLSQPEIDAVTAFMEALQEPIDCPLGRCCVFAPPYDCLDSMREDECQNVCGYWTLDATCQQPCPLFVAGACCLEDSCVDDVASTWCECMGGTYMGHFTECECAECPPPTGACCLLSGTCTETNQENCEQELCGFYQGDGSQCDELVFDCPIVAVIPGACCMPDGKCGETFECDCASRGGVWQGNFSKCDGLECPQGKVCGGIVGIPCDDPNQFCKLNVGECCCDFQGFCTDIPQGCPRVIDPVCGCDGVTYLNECEAHRASMSIAHEGACRGACCLWSGVCVEEVTEEECGCLCGTFQGGGTVCGEFCEFEPDTTGACCLPEAVCEELAPCKCERREGLYHGDGTDCESVPCEPGEGSCCLPNGTCTITDECQCDNQCGTFGGVGVLCGLCPVQPTGRCCRPNGTCVQLTSCQCADACGAFGGVGTACGGLCPIPLRGACCLPDGDCRRISSCECARDCGTFHGAGTHCQLIIEQGEPELIGEMGDLQEIEPIEPEPEPQPQPILCVAEPDGACCLPDGSCVVMPECDCNDLCGEFQGNGTSCTPELCDPPPPGACCRGDGTCQVTTAAACNGPCDAYQGDNTSCATPGICAAQAPRACCLANNQCLDLSPCVCLSQGGTSQAPGILCASDPCSPDCATPTLGCWGEVLPWGTIAVHMVALKNGLVQIADASFPNTVVRRFNPADDTIGPPESVTTGHPLFCSGHAQTADGRVLYVGGLTNDVNFMATLYEPDTNTWVAADDNSANRFYPALTTLSTGKILVLGGSGSTTARTPNIFDPTQPSGQQWRLLAGAAYGTSEYPFDLPNYPRVVQTSSLAIYYGSAESAGTGIEQNTRYLDTRLEKWIDLFAIPDPIEGGSGLMYALDKLMKAGGPQFGPSMDLAYVLDLTVATPQWTAIAPMNHARQQFLLIALPGPEGSVLALGGTDLGNPVMTPEKYNAATNQWADLAPHAEQREYHSSAVLLSDARVLSGGGTHDGQGNDTAQVYSPPYLFNPNGTFAARPVITALYSSGGSNVVRYGRSFTIESPQASSIAIINLIRLGASTHAWDHNQRAVTLSFNPPNNGAITVAAPRHDAQAPPGYYYVFAVNTAGVPSKAAIVRLENCP